MKIVQISAGRDRSVVLASDGSAHGWGGIKRLGATLPPGYPGELCLSSPTEIGHNRYAQPVPQALNPHQPLAALADGYIETLAVQRSGAVLSYQPIVSDQGAAHAEIAGLPPGPQQVALTESASFALYADGSVWSWGLSGYGQLGRVAPSSLNGPAPITTLAPIARLATGNGHVWRWTTKARCGLGVPMPPASWAPAAWPKVRGPPRSSCRRASSRLPLVIPTALPPTAVAACGAGVPTTLAKPAIWPPNTPARRCASTPALPWRSWMRGCITP